MRRRAMPPELQAWIAAVVDDNADDLLRYLRRRVNQPDDAADLLGRVLLTLWETGEKMPTSDTDARMWCFGIARNLLREHYRRAAKNLALADELRDHLRSSEASENSASITAETNLRDAGVRAAIATLDAKSRELIMLVHWDGFSIAAAARLLSMNDSTARTRYGRALQRLEYELREHPHTTGLDHTAAPHSVPPQRPKPSTPPPSPS